MACCHYCIRSRHDAALYRRSAKKEQSKVAGIGGHGNEMGIGQVNGGSAGGVVPKFTDIMDEFRIARRARTEKEIQDMIKDLLPVEPFQKISATWGAIRSTIIEG